MKLAAARIMLAGAAFALGPLFARADAAGDRHFLDRVKPLLDSRCVSCHGADKVKGGLRLDSREGALKAGESGAPAVVPGNPAESLLLQAVLHSRPDLEMPPKDKLTTNDIAILERWIRDGAPWPDSPAAVDSTVGGSRPDRIGDAWTDPRNPIARLFAGQRLDLWSLRPIQDPTPPPVRNRRWVRTAVDPFVLARLEAAGQAPRPEANRRTLARRLYFDLTGLPPTPDQVVAFLADPRPDAVEHLVDQLLNSRAYAEHWARLWLDVVRYSDSNGFDWDEFRPMAWRYRDYVIRSIQADKPFDRFIREQLAGDELVDGPPRSRADQDALIATGFLRLGPQDNSAASFNEQDRARAELMADLTETTGSAFLGLTLSCCRCHDHKFDPLSQADHFRLRAFFEPVKAADDTPLDLAADQDAIRNHNQSVDARLAPLQQERDGILAALKARLRAERLDRLAPEERQWLNRPAAERTNELKSKIEGIERKVTPSDKEVKAALAGAAKERYARLDRELAAIQRERRPLTHGLLMTDQAGKIPATHILFQGDYQAKKEPVEPGFLSILDPNPAVVQPAINRRTTGRRLTLADWIASPRNPLTARVLVNRAWLACFGVALVETPNDFGLAGARPTDPALLDSLATRFVRDGWSLKQLLRTIVTSASYRQIGSDGSSDGHREAGRRTTRRLSAEQLRDALLAVSGLLTTRAGGPPVWPELPTEILQANPAFLDDNDMKTKGWYPSPTAERHARSVYLVQKRTVRVPFMETFDLPENSVSCARRTSSIVAPQAMALLNSPLAAEAAQALARRIRSTAGASPAKQVELAFRLALQRPPTAGECQVCQKFLEQHGLAALTRSVLNLNEFVYVD